MGRKITFDVPEGLDEMVVKQGVAVISGWKEGDGTPIFQILSLDDTPTWIAAGLFERARMASDAQFMRGWQSSG